MQSLIAHNIKVHLYKLGLQFYHICDGFSFYPTSKAFESWKWDWKHGRFYISQISTLVVLIPQTCTVIKTNKYYLHGWYSLDVQKINNQSKFIC